MEVKRPTRSVATAACLLLGTIFVCVPAFAVEPAMPASVEVYWKSTRTIAAPGATTVVILEDEIAHAEIGVDTIEFAGLSRGDTVALAYVKGLPVSIVVHVIDHPVQIIPPSLRQHDSEMAHGTFGSDFQTTNSGNSSPITLVNSLSWSQQVGDHAMDFNSQVEDDSQFGGHSANLRSGALSYRTPHTALYVLDFSQSLTGASGEDRINNFSSPSSVLLRGAGLTLRQGKNEYSFFGGSTVPYYFLSLNGTRDVAGFSFHRKQSDRLSLFGGTSYLNIPVSLSDGIHRRNYAMQTAGVAYRIGKNFRVGTEGGISTAGKMARADASYNSYRLSGYGTAIYASQTFPLNQLQSLFSGTSSFKGGIAYKLTSRLNQSFFAEHTEIVPGLIYRVRGSTDYLSPNLVYNLARGETLNFAYTYSRNTGGFTSGVNTGNRYDVALQSQIGPRLANNAQVTFGSVQDPLQISSQDDFSVRDSISVPIRGQTLLLGVEHDRVQPSLIARLNQELNLLSPALQTEFLANPSAFLDSTNFPPEVKALLAAEQPTGTTFSASSNLNIGSRLRLSPNLSVTHAANGSLADAWTQSFGYSLAFQISPTLQFRSALTNVLLWNSQLSSAQRTTVLSAGFQKSFSSAPGALPLLHRNRIIEGRVFRDNNINGTFNLGEPGIQDIEVRLDDGETATTDPQGRYRFSSVSAAQHQVSIDLKQFRQPIRMTTSSEIEADLIQQRFVAVNFGVLDFARVMGNVYNDLRFENRRQPDSKGMESIGLLLDDGKNVRKIETSSSGEFELDNVPPGDYKLSLDSASLPANYSAVTDTFSIHVSPVSTVLQDIPMRALRSISGRVLLKTTALRNGASIASETKMSGAKLSNPRSKSSGSAEPTQNFTLVPVGGVRIIAGQSTAVTDGEGNFLLRNLPAGDLNVTIQPVSAVPDEIKIPSGPVKMPAEPVQIQDATIIITNADLLPYLTRQLPGIPGPSGQPVIVAADSRLTQKQRTNALLGHAGMPANVDAQTNAQSERSHVVTPTAPNSMVPPEPSVAQLHSGARPLAFPIVSPLAAVATLHSSAKAETRESIQGGAVVLASVTRAFCASLPSLGEAAQCFQQLKHNRAGSLQ